MAPSGADTTKIPQSILAAPVIIFFTFFTNLKVSVSTFIHSFNSSDTSKLPLFHSYVCKNEVD